MLACLLGCGYSLHRDAPWGQRRQPKAHSPASTQAGCIPTSFSSKPTPSPPGRAFKLANEWEESTVRMVRRAEIPQCDVRFALEPLFKSERNVRLADTRLPRKHHHSAFLLRRVLPPAQ